MVSKDYIQYHNNIQYVLQSILKALGCIEEKKKMTLETSFSIAYEFLSFGWGFDFVLEELMHRRSSVLR